MKKIGVVFFTAVFLFVSCQNKQDSKTGKAYYEGEDISDIASIIRDKNTKTATLLISVGGNWVLYAGVSDDKIDYSEPLAGGFQSGRYSLGSDSSRMYYQLITDIGRGIFMEKRLPMEGGYNFRDLGGIKNKDGKYVKWGKLFRSDDMYNLTESDLNYLSGIPITSVVDFRAENEVKKAPDKIPASVKQDAIYSLPIMPGNLGNFVMEDISGFSGEKIDALMNEMYVSLVSDSSCIKQYRELFRILQNENNVPLLFHCSAGKDRTGMATAFILFALNVDEETILEDYLSSNMYLGNKYAAVIKQNPNLKPLFEVKPEFLMTGIDKIKKDYGSIENYLKEVMNVDIDSFRSKYLY